MGALTAEQHAALDAAPATVRPILAAVFEHDLIVHALGAADGLPDDDGEAAIALIAPGLGPDDLARATMDRLARQAAHVLVDVCRTDATPYSDAVEAALTEGLAVIVQPPAALSRAWVDWARTVERANVRCILAKPHEGTRGMA